MCIKWIYYIHGILVGDLAMHPKCDVRCAIDLDLSKCVHYGLFFYHISCRRVFVQEDIFA